MDIFTTKLLKFNFFYIAYEECYKVIVAVVCSLLSFYVNFENLFIAPLFIYFLIPSLTLFLVKNKNNSYFLLFFKLVLNLSKNTNKNFTVDHIILHYSIFFIIFLLNFFGILPYFPTATASLLATIFLSYCLFSLINFNKIKTANSRKWSRVSKFSFFLPSGLDKVVIPVIFIIEIMSYFVKIFSISMRLFANMLAGHLLLKIAGSISFSIFSTMLSLNFSLVMGFFSFSLVCAIILLEIAISFIQAYVFTVLFIIYTSENL